jgi:hypothetical protein
MYITKKNILIFLCIISVFFLVKIIYDLSIIKGGLEGFDNSNILNTNVNVGSISSFGETKQAYESSIIPSGLQNHILGYNPKDVFYSYTDKKFDGNNCDKKVYLLDPNTKEYRDNDISCNYVFNIPKYDNVNNKTKCYQREMCKNQNLADTISNKTEQHQNNIQSYVDSKTNYNIQIINTINISIGIGLVIVSLYKFRK